MKIGENVHFTDLNLVVKYLCDWMYGKNTIENLIAGGQIEPPASE